VQETTGRQWRYDKMRHEVPARANQEDAMTEHVYKLTEIVGTSRESQEAAIHNALARAHKSIHGIRWFEVVNQRGYVEPDGALFHQVTLRSASRSTRVKGATAIAALRHKSTRTAPKS